MVDLVDQPSRNGATAAAAQWWSAEQCPDDAQGQGGPTDRPDLHQTISNPRSIYAKADLLTGQTNTKQNHTKPKHFWRFWQSCCLSILAPVTFLTLLAHLLMSVLDLFAMNSRSKGSSKFVISSNTWQIVSKVRIFRLNRFIFSGLCYKCTNKD